MASQEVPQLQALATAAENLTYPSESDEPFDMFHWKGSSKSSAEQALRQHAGRERQMGRVSFDEFFSALDDADNAPRFEALRRVLEAQLRELTIYRVGEGEAEVDIYLMGRLPDGDWAGLHTCSVET